VVAGEVAGGLAVDKGAGDLVVAVGVVVQHPGGQGDRGIQQRIADGLGSGGLLQEVPEAAAAEAGQGVGGGVFLFGVGWLRAGQDRDQQVQVDAGQPGGAWRPMASVTEAPTSPPWAT
jgi:hypothetical protein